MIKGERIRYGVVRITQHMLISIKYHFAMNKFIEVCNLFFENWMYDYMYFLELIYLCDQIKKLVIAILMGE